MKPYDIYLLAQWLFDNKKCPEGFRSTVSRAYYGAFHTAISLLAEMEILVHKKKNKHELVPDLLQHTGDDTLVRVGEKLRDLKDGRNVADYELDDREAETSAFAAQRLTDAKDIIATLSTAKTSKGTVGGRFEKSKAAAKKWADFIFLGITE
jgi:uncharacterized protein (UPF0332 family)